LFVRNLLRSNLPREEKRLASWHRYKSSRRNQRLLGWSIFVTNVLEDKIKSEKISSLYRTRWQIELLFKLYKSYAKIEKLKGGANPQGYYVSYMLNYV